MPGRNYDFRPVEHPLPEKFPPAFRIILAINDRASGWVTKHRELFVLLNIEENINPDS
jgi:hypothetical protein